MALTVYEYYEKNWIKGELFDKIWNGYNEIKRGTGRDVPMLINMIPPF